MVNCVECGAPLGRADQSCGACGAQPSPGAANGTRHPRFDDPDGMVYEDSPLLHDDHDDDDAAPRRDRSEPHFVRQPLHDDPTVVTPPFAAAALLAAPAIEAASFASRAVALVIDLVLLGLLDGVLLALASGAVMLAERVSGTRVAGALDLVGAAVSAGSMTLFLGYFSVLHARSGQTLGKVAMRIRVADRGGEPVGIRASVLRTMAYGLSALPLGAGFLLALGPARRALHDRIAGTVVVRDRTAA